MKPIVEKISFYPYRFTFCDKIGAYIIERYESVKHQWIIVDRGFGEKHEIEEHVHKLNMEAGKVEETYNEDEKKEIDKDDKENKEEK